VLQSDPAEPGAKETCSYETHPSHRSYLWDQ